MIITLIVYFMFPALEVTVELPLCHVLVADTLEVRTPNCIIWELFCDVKNLKYNDTSQDITVILIVRCCDNTHI